MSKPSPVKHISRELRLSDSILQQAATDYGTPLYIYDKHVLEHSWNTLKQALPRKIQIYYSVKANPNISIINVFRQLGAYFEVASVGELMATQYAGVDPKSVIFVGPGKSARELHSAVSIGLKAIVVESRREVEDVKKISSLLNKETHIALRINPGFGKGMLTMGGSTQFGMPPEVVLDILNHAEEYSPLKVVGIHGYLGTRVLDWKMVLEHSRIILEIAAEMQKQAQMELTFVDIGGGAGIPYYERDSPLDINSLSPELGKLVDEYCSEFPKTDTIAFESGRFLVGTCGVFVARVIDVKINGSETFVILDGGINVFGGIDIYGGSRSLPVRCVGHPARTNVQVTLCGPLCTPMDRLASGIVLEEPTIGDLVCFYQVGAYGLTASPGLFLSHGFPGEVLATEQDLVLIRERSTLESLFQHQLAAFRG